MKRCFIKICLRERQSPSLMYSIYTGADEKTKAVGHITHAGLLLHTASPTLLGPAAGGHRAPCDAHQPGSERTASAHTPAAVR